MTANAHLESQALPRVPQRPWVSLSTGWSPDDEPEVQALLRQLASQLLADDNRMIRDSRPVATNAPVT